MVHSLLKQSHGRSPEVVQDDVFAEGIHCLLYAAEARQLLVGTSSGFLIRLNSDGTQTARVRGFEDLHHLAWSHDGRFGAAVVGDKRLIVFDGHLRQKWKLAKYGKINAVAISPFGSHVAIATEFHGIRIFTSEKKEVTHIETAEAVHHLQFVQNAPALIAAAEYGLLCRYNLDGQLEFEERVMNNVGGLAATADGKRILLAAFNHGVQVLDADGTSVGSFQIDGLPANVVCSMDKQRVGVTTLESRLYAINFQGDLKWACDLTADPVHTMTMDHSGDRLWIATVSGRLLQLQW